MALYLAHSAEHYVPPSWSTGTVEEIAEALRKHYDGVVDLADYWAIGDERTVSLSAMEATGVADSHPAQNATFVLMNKGGKTLADGITECAFVVGQKNILANGTTASNGKMNSTKTNVGGWTSSERRTWCNDVYRLAVPSDLRALFKQFRNKTSAGNQSQTINTDLDFFAMPSKVEVDGDTTNIVYREEGTQFKYYETQANRLKGTGNSNSNFKSAWWLRTPNISEATAFYGVTNAGNLTVYGATTNVGLAPFGCI